MWQTCCGMRTKDNFSYERFFRLKYEVCPTKKNRFFDFGKKYFDDCIEYFDKGNDSLLFNGVFTKWKGGRNASCRQPSCFNDYTVISVVWINIGRYRD